MADEIFQKDNNASRNKCKALTIHCPFFFQYLKH